MAVKEVRALMKKWVGRAVKGRSEEGRAMGGRRRSRNEKCRKSTFANTGQRPAQRHCSLALISFLCGSSFVWKLMGSRDLFLSMQEGNISRCTPRPALVLKGKLGPGMSLEVLSLVSSKGGTCSRISWLHKRRYFLFLSRKACHWGAGGVECALP